MRRDGFAVIAEGVVLDVAPGDLEGLHEVEHDDHGHLRIAEVNIGEMLGVPMEQIGDSNGQMRELSEVS